ncbi:MAG: DUF368 domain-containing protein [Blastopirellula sp. JB062]
MNDSLPNSSSTSSHWLRAAARHWGCGLLMGAADAIPGVSGGTVALVLGIYRRLVAAISHFDAEAVQLLLKRQWRALAQRIDFFFLLALGGGVVVGLATFIILIHELIADGNPARPYAYAIFFGAIAASSWLVMKLIDAQTTNLRIVSALLGLGGALFAYWLTGLETLEEVHAAPHLGFTFCCGMVAISAMILPGISGSYILLILGMYHYLSGIPKSLLKGEAVSAELVQFFVFAIGCAVGLIAFSKFLRWLLYRYEPQTMALMCGFMVGAMRKLWPWADQPTIFPASGGELIGCAAAAIVAALVVCGADYLTGAEKKIDRAVHEPVK